MQWKQMDFSFMVDPFNLLNMRFVPSTVAIDEYGVIQAVQPRLDRANEFEQLFINATFDAPSDDWVAKKYVTQADKPTDENAAETLSDYAIALTLWGDESQLDEAVSVSEKALTIAENDRTHFNLGVIYRMRYDSAYRQPSDFINAVKHWTAALNHDPNNYIWRRRIQQYGPRLDKPYPFYDWVPQAREAIIARGATPRPLKIEPGGAEFAEPLQTFETTEAVSEPDPDDKIYHDDEFVQADIVVVPPEIVAGESVRVHVTLHPASEAHWNNEVDDTLLWLTDDAHWTIDQPLQSVPNAQGDTSDEPRHFEVEIRSKDDLQAGEYSLSAYSLYYICEDVNGICLYRRQNFEIPIKILSPDGRRLKDGG